MSAYRALRKTPAAPGGLGGRLHHADDKPHNGPAHIIVVKTCDTSRSLQSQQPGHDVFAIGLPIATRGKERVRTLPHLAPVIAPAEAPIMTLKAAR
ncbi:hypothetical protein QO004_005055 [Rhizobium mesoamericanum]|uniref:hypothetical protein n=1 Tax=Rhizobium mesoamericanum TaxID=1079800 RepID=UPI002787E3E2|nr:hypothetical protein [Rhizobium mesoamericanum]MDQ0563246.1 hypothetical protein [Rhizobium mesoamericanum]